LTFEYFVFDGRWNRERAAGIAELGVDNVKVTVLLYGAGSASAGPPANITPRRLQVVASNSLVQLYFMISGSR
jgi:hypothetical protein